MPLPAAPYLHSAAVWQTRSCSVSCGVYGRPFALACAPRPDRPSSARRTYPSSDATASSGMPWPWRSSTLTKARSGWVPSLTSMLAVPVVTKVRNRTSNSSERGFRHKSHTILRTERELLRDTHPLRVSVAHSRHGCPERCIRPHVAAHVMCWSAAIIWRRTSYASRSAPGMQRDRRRAATVRPRCMLHMARR